VRFFAPLVFRVKRIFQHNVLYVLEEAPSNSPLAASTASPTALATASETPIPVAIRAGSIRITVTCSGHSPSSVERLEQPGYIAFMRGGSALAGVLPPGQKVDRSRLCSQRHGVQNQQRAAVGDAVQQRQPLRTPIIEQDHISRVETQGWRHAVPGEAAWRFSRYSCRGWRSRARHSARKTLSRDCYGTSRRFASTLRSSIMETGRRSDIVLRDGFRWTRFLRFPACQSTYSVESAVAQSFLSSSSFLNSGSFFFISLAEITRMSFRLAEKATNNRRPAPVCPRA